jgi:uncharacterized protein (TIGR04255 family)
MTDTNPKQKINTLSEVLIEIRFSPVNDTSLIVGNIFTELKGRYPNFINLNVPDLPDGFPDIKNIVKYRFTTKDEKNLYQLGKGVLAINTLNYVNFTKFLEDVNQVLTAYKKLSGVKIIERIGLRYINKIKVKNHEINKYFNINLTLPEILQRSEASFSFQTNSQFDGDQMVTRLLTEQPTANEIVILDFDYSNQMNQEYDMKNLNKWVTKAHDIIYEAYRSSLTDTFYNKLI